jgi:hypothetical protein
MLKEEGVMEIKILHLAVAADPQAAHTTPLDCSLQQ